MPTFEQPIKPSAQRFSHSTLPKIEEWLRDYPSKHQPELLGKLNSKVDIQRTSSCFELLLHALFRQMGFSLTIHPSISGSKNRPDFLVEVHDQERFYVEACVVQGQPDIDQEKASFSLQGCLEDVQSSIYTVQASIHKNPGGTLPCKQIKNHVRKMFTAGESNDYNRNGWHVEFSLIKNDSSIARSPDVTFVGSLDEFEPIRKQVAKKAKDHGSLDSPFIIALQILTPGVLQQSSIDPFLSALQTVFHDQSGRPRYRRVSGLLGFSNADGGFPRSVCYYPNPKAKYPLTNPFPRLPRLRITDADNRFLPGDSLTSILGLPDDSQFPWEPRAPDE